MSASEDKTAANGNHATAKRPLRDGIDTARGQVSDVAHDALDRTRDGLGHARERATLARHGVADGIEANPLLALAGGAALGLVIGALLPRTEREGELYGAIGDRLGVAAKEALGAAKDAGREKFADMGFSRDSAKDAFRSVIDAAIAAAGSAGTAAVDSTRQPKPRD